MEYTYRPMTMDDYDECVKLWDLAPNMALSKADERQNLEIYLNKNPEQSFVCHMGDELVGTILCGNDGRRAYIYHTAVHPGHRRGGIGKKLAALAVEKQTELKMTRIQLNIVNENEQGQAFWREQGFKMRTDVGHMIRFIDDYWT